jgi:hypothetical protein
MRDLAGRLGMSDVGLKKILRSHGVPIPPQGHWNRVHAGRSVAARPAVPARRPGDTGRVRLDERFSAVLTPAEPLSPHGPFASALVPEDLEELRAQELKAIGRVTVPRALSSPHKALHEVLVRDEKRRQKLAANPFSYAAPEFDTPLARRQLQILNALFLALTKRGHDARLSDRDGELSASAIVGHTTVGLALAPLGKHPTTLRHGYYRPAPDLPAKTPLSLRIYPGYAQQDSEAWKDDVQGKLEEKIPVIVAGIIVAGEQRFRRHLQEEADRREALRRAAEKAQQERLAALNLRRLEDLRTSGELLRQAEDLRSLVARVKLAMAAGESAIDTGELRAWETWALSEADRLDPIKSGQITTHLRPPDTNSTGNYR